MAFLFEIIFVFMRQRNLSVYENNIEYEPFWAYCMFWLFKLFYKKVLWNNAKFKSVSH